MLGRMFGIPFDQDGILLRRDAVRLGLDDNWLLRMRRAGALIRIRQGAYADPGIWLRQTPAEQHVTLSRAVLRQYDDRVALSHASAHVIRGGPDWGLDLATVNLTNLLGRGDRRQAGVTHHRGRTRAADVTRLDGHWITAPARTAVETPATLDIVPAICVLDWTLHQGLATTEQLAWYVAHPLREWAGSVHLPTAVERACPASESVGETRTRALLEDAGLQPEPQWEVRHPSGAVAGRVDFLLRDLGLMIEFDGYVKYGRLLKPGQSINDVVLAERRRELLLEELTGYRMFRLIWSDLDRRQRTIDRIRRAAARRVSA